MPGLTTHTDADDPAWARVCLNCDQPLSGRFCGNCGQRALPPHPTVRQLAGDAWAELAGWDGKFAHTVRTLIRHPGALTRTLLEGQRARYVSPVRLYLTCSVLYFLVAAVAPVPLDEEEFEVSAGFSYGVGPDEQTPEEAAYGKAVLNGLAALTPEERALAEREIADQPWVFQPMLRAMAVDYQRLRQRTVETLPRALFVLIPALAAILAIFHRNRHYPDHLYFAIHLQAFVFLALTLLAASQFMGSRVAIAAQLVIGIGIVAYVVIAQRRVYGGSWPASVLKTLGVGVTYMVLWGCVSLGVTLWVSRT